MARPQIDIGGVRTWDDLGLVLADATEGSPEPQTHYVNVPGRDGALDMTEAFGGVSFKDREDSYTFVAPGMEDTLPATWLRRSRLLNRLNGLEADYRLSWEPDYVRHGRWSVDGIDGKARRRLVSLRVRARPYKSRGTTVVYVNAAGGVRVRLESGRRPVQPRIEVSRPSVVSVDGRSWDLEPGTWVLDDLWLHQGDNVVAIDTTPGLGDRTMSDYAEDAASALAGSMLSEVATGGSGVPVPVSLSSLAGDRLWEHEYQRLLDVALSASSSDPTVNAYFAYEWEDL